MGGPGSGPRPGQGLGKHQLKKLGLQKMTKLRKQILGKSRPPKNIRKAMKRLLKANIWRATTN